MARAEAPGRANLIGEHLDYVGGLCLPIALEQRTRATVTLRGDDGLVFRSGTRCWIGALSDLRPGLISGWAAYVGGVLWALGVDRGVEVDVESDLPVAAGLSSSAALESSVALAVDGLFSLGCTRHEIAEACHRVETDMVGVPTGSLDQLVAMFATTDHALLADFSSAAPLLEQIRFRPEREDLALVVIDTGVTHDMTDGRYGRRRSECNEAASLLGLLHLAEAAGTSEELVGNLPKPLAARTRYVVSETDRVRRFAQGLRDGTWETLGPILTAGHESARDDFAISCAELDTAVAAAREGGALGARMTGGGFGGCAIALVHTSKVRRMQAVVTSTFADNGWPAPAFMEARAGAAGKLLEPPGEGSHDGPEHGLGSSRG